MMQVEAAPGYGMETRWRAFATLSLAVFISVLDLFIVNIAFPDIRREWPGAGLSGLAWVLSAYAIVLAALLVPLGRLGDLVGRKRVFEAGLALFVLASALCAAAPSPGLLIAARVLQGMMLALALRSRRLAVAASAMRAPAAARADQARP